MATKPNDDAVALSSSWWSRDAAAIVGSVQQDSCRKGISPEAYTANRMYRVVGGLSVFVGGRD